MGLLLQRRNFTEKTTVVVVVVVVVVVAVVVQNTALSFIVFAVHLLLTFVNLTKVLKLEYIKVC